MAGAYEATYAADPSSFVTSSATTATSILLAAGAGFLATSLLGVVVVQDREEERAAEAAAESPLFAPTEPPVGEYEGAGNHAPARPYTAAEAPPSGPARHPSLRPPAGGLTCDARPPPRPPPSSSSPSSSAPRASPALAADSGDVAVTNTETVQARLSATGAFQGARVYEQLALTGHGTATIENPVSTEGPAQPRRLRRLHRSSTASSSARWPSTASGANAP